MIVATLAELEAYFERLADAHPDIRQFVVGDAIQILSLDRSQLNYPVLWLETPEVDWQFGHRRQRTYNIAFVVLVNTTNDLWEQERYLKNWTLEITAQLLRWIQDDIEEEVVQAEMLSAKSMSIQTYGNDNDRGWRTDLRLLSSVNWCPPSCKRIDACPAGTLAKFSWNNANAGDFTALTITNLSLPEDEGWTWEWAWQIDDEAPGMSASEVPAISGSGDNILITLKITSGDCERYASAFFSSAQNCGESVPYVLKKEYVL